VRLHVDDEFIGLKELSKTKQYGTDFFVILEKEIRGATRGWASA